MAPQTVQGMAPVVLVVGLPEPCEALAARIREHGYPTELCPADAVGARLASDRMPGALVLCSAGIDVAAVMRDVRDTPSGTAVVITLYGALGDTVRDLADVLDLGADLFLPAPASDEELSAALEHAAGPARPAEPPPAHPGGNYGSWPNRTEVLDGPDDAAGVPSADAMGSELGSRSGPPGNDPADARATSEGSAPLQVRANHVLGQLHRTLDMLEHRLRDGVAHDGGRLDRLEDDLSTYGLDAVPDVDEGTGPMQQRRDAGRLGVEEFELPLAVLHEHGLGPRRASAGPESTVRLEETGELEPPPVSGTAATHARSGRPRREPLEPELESELQSEVIRDRPRRVRPLPIDRQGNLDVVEVPRLLWTLHRARFSGRLTLQRGKIEKSVWLDDGNFVFARSNVGHDRLSDGLLRRGVLTRSQYETARRLAAGEPRRSGHILVEAGFLKPGELHRVLRLHLARILDSTFPWRDGHWLLVPDDECDEPVLIEDVPARVLSAGIRNRMEPAQLVDLLGGLDVVPRFDSAGATVIGMHEVVDLLRMTPSEEHWIERLDGRHSLAELTEEAGADELELFGLVYLLHVMGYVELAREPEPEPRPDLRPEELDRQRIGERLRMSRELDYFEVLGLDRDACRVDVQRAYAELSATFAAENLEHGIRRQLDGELVELREALAEARDVLADDGLRSAYLAHLEEP